MILYPNSRSIVTSQLDHVNKVLPEKNSLLRGTHLLHWRIILGY